MHYIKHEQVATVMVATAHITATAQLDPSYSPDGGNVHAPVYIHVSLGSYASAPPPNGISIGSTVFAGLVVMINTLSDTGTQTDHGRQYKHRNSPHLAL